MSKVISFSISDRYLDKLRSLYPSLTDNLAAKQFLTDGLESSLGNSLDGSLDDGLDGKLKTLIESELDGLLDERLDAVVGKSLTSLSDRLSRLEERLYDSLYGRLDDMERLLRLQREASITSPLPTGEPSHDEPDRPAIETLPKVETVSTDSSIEPVTDAIEDSEKKIIPLPDTLIGSPIGIDEIVSTDSSIKSATDAIETVRGDSPQLKNQLVTAVDIKTRQGLTNTQLSKKKGIPARTIQNWANKIQKGKKITSLKYPDFFKQWRLNPTDSLWYEVD